MTSSEKIVRSASKALSGELQLPASSGYCLRLVRLVIEHALNIDFYGTYLTHKVEPPAMIMIRGRVTWNAACG